MAKAIRIRVIFAALITILGVATVLAVFNHFALPPFFAAVTAFALVITCTAGTCLVLLPNPAAWPDEQPASMPYFLPAGNQAHLDAVPLFLDSIEAEEQALDSPEPLPEAAPVPAMSKALPVEDAKPPTADLLDLRWAQLTSPHARHLLLAAAECSPGRPIPHRLLQRATRLEPDAYHHAVGLLCDLGLLQSHFDGPIIAAHVADHAHRAARRHGLPSRLPAVARAAIHLTTEALWTQPQPFTGQLWGHAERLANFTRWAGLPETRALWYNVACRSMLVGNHQRAAEALLEVVDLDTDRDGFDHPAVATGLSFERALPLLARTYGPDHARTHITCTRLETLSHDL
jgi:hypothetical protein